MDTTQINRELIISSDVSEVNIVLLEDKQLVEFHKEQKNNSISVGDVYLGRVKKILPGLNSAFIDIGSRKDAFLHYLDLGPQLKSLKKFTRLAEDGNVSQLNMESFELENDIDKTGKISDFISVGDRIPVQIAKEPINTKGPRITADISFAGRYIVLVPFSNRVSVSQKIKSSEERRRLKQLIQSIRPNNFGVIVRTVAEGKKIEELENEISKISANSSTYDVDILKYKEKIKNIREEINTKQISLIEISKKEEKVTSDIKLLQEIIFQISL